VRTPDLSRIVSLEPSATATLFALGAQDRVVAVSEWCDRLVDLGDRPRLPSTWSATPQAILALAPDLVIASAPYREETLVDLLRAGVDLLCLYPQDLSDVRAHILLLARMVGREEAGRALLARLDSALQEARRRTANRPRRRVFVEIWPRPLMSASPWVAEMVEWAGGTFVPEGSAGRQVSEEEVARADPEVIVVAWTGVRNPPVEKEARRPAWQGVSAVREGRVVAVEEILLNAPGPNLAEGALHLARAIHPEAFAE